MGLPRRVPAVLAALLLAGSSARAAAARHPPLGPFPSGVLQVRLRSDVPLSFCEVVLSRDGTIVRRGKPDPASGTIAFERLAPGRYDVSATGRSFVPHGPTRPHHARRVAVWMRNGRADGGAEIKVRRHEKPDVLELRVQWSRPVAEYLVTD